MVAHAFSQSLGLRISPFKIAELSAGQVVEHTHEGGTIREEIVHQVGSDETGSAGH
jgi:hypothetical protein